MNSSLHFDNERNDILNLGKVLTQRLDDTTVTAEAKYPISYIRKKIYMKSTL